MERYTVLMAWNNLHCLNVHTTHNNLQIHGNTYKIPLTLFYRNGGRNTKICIGSQKTPQNPSNHEKEEPGSLTLPDLELYYKAIIIKIVLYWHKNRPMNATESGVQK